MMHARGTTARRNYVWAQLTLLGVVRAAGSQIPPSLSAAIYDQMVARIPAYQRDIPPVRVYSESVHNIKLRVLLSM